MALTGNSAGGVAVIDIAAVVARQSAGGRLACDRTIGVGFGDGAAVVAHQTAGSMHTVNGSRRRAFVHSAGDGEQRIPIGHTRVQADQTSHIFLAADRTGHRAAAHQVGLVLGQIGLIQLRLGIAHQAAHVLFAGNVDLRQLQIFDSSALDDVEEAHIRPVGPGYGHVGNGVALAVERTGKGRCRAADTWEGNAFQIQIGCQLVVLAQRISVCGRGQRHQIIQ